MSKKKTVNKRRKVRAVKSGGGQNSQYGNKLAQAKQGRFKKDSPFILVEGGEGLSLAEFNKTRTKKHVII